MRIFLLTIIASIQSFGITVASAQEGDVNKLLEQSEESLNNNLKHSQELASKALEVALALGDSLAISKSYYMLGYNFSMQGAFDVSFQKYSKSYEFCPHNEEALKASIGLKFTRFFMLTKHFDKALDYIQQSFDIYTRLSDSAGIADCYNFRGLTYVNMNENKLAEKDFYSAIKINQSLGREEYVMRNYNNLALYESDKPTQKIELLKLAIKHNEKNNDVWSLGENYNNLGVQYFYAKDYKNALKNLEIAKKYAKSLEANELICDNYRYMSWVYQALGRSKEAYDNLLAMYELERVMITERLITEREINTLAIKLTALEQQQESERQIHSLTVMRRNAIIIIVILIVIIAGFVVTIFVRNWRRRLVKMDQQIETSQVEKEIVEQNLESRKRELVALSFHIRARLDIVEKIKEMLRECVKSDERQVKQDLKKVILFINTQQAKDQEIDILTNEVEVICGEFLENLKKLHPELTRNELQLAAFLRINMSSKEISMLTGTCEKSVNMARYRLRKHLDLNNDVNLQDFIKRIKL